eukprot:m.906652 g.906652  ORF g.906652 m.906652 type:complete len:809 (-) comp23706_c0_seq14:367-2793(-)
MSTETIEKHSAADARCRKCRTDLAGDENFSCSKKYTCFVLNCTKDNRCGKNSLCNYCYRNAGPKTINIRLRSLIAGYENVDSKLGGPSSTDKIATSFGTKLDETLSSMKDMFTRNESYKCGSAAKGTGIGGYSDLDLVVALTWNESESGRTVVPMLASILEAAPSFDIEVLCKNDVSLRVRFDSLEIDIIPVEFKDWRKSLEDRVEMFKESQEKDRKKLRLNPSSTLFMKEQVDFVKQNKKDLTGLIRLVKRWVAQHSWSEEAQDGSESYSALEHFTYKPISYAIELLFCHFAATDVDQTNLRLIMERFWRWVANCRTEDAVINLGDTAPDPLIAEERPLIVDPVNNANNVAAWFDWLEFEAIAVKMLKTEELFVDDLMDSNVADQLYGTLDATYLSFVDELEQCWYLIQQSSNAVNQHSSSTAEQPVWNPPQAHIARVFFDAGWDKNEFKRENAPGDRCTTRPEIQFSCVEDKAAYHQILKGNLLTMWVAWEALIQEAHTAAWMDLVTRARERACKKGTFTKESFTREFEKDIFALSRAKEPQTDRDGDASKGDWEDIEEQMKQHCIEFTLVPVSRRQKNVALQPMLGNLVEFRQRLLIATVKIQNPSPIHDDDTMRKFRFEMQCDSFSASVEGSSRKAATVLLKFFQSIRNFVSHGDSQNTVQSKCLKDFVKGIAADASVGAGSTESKTVTTNILNMFNDVRINITLVGPRRAVDESSSVSSADGGDAGGECAKQAVAEWMAEQLLLFRRKHQDATISSSLLETMYACLESMGKSYVGALMDNVKTVYPRLAIPWLCRLWRVKENR